MSVFGKIFEKGQADCPVDASGNIGVISVDKDGIITFTNAGGRKILQDLRGKGLPRQLVGRSLPELLGRRLSDTLMGRALMTEQELSGQLLMFGQTRYMTTIQLHRDSQGEVAGCTLYTIAAEGAESHSGLWQRFAYDLATHLGYNSIDWILNISDQHAQLLTKCLTTTEPAVPITRYCPYKFQCAFHPEHGWAALDRRMYHRVPIEIPIHGHLVKLPSGQTTSEQVREKVIGGHTIDLSLGGTQLQCPVKLPLYSTIEIEFRKLPEPLVCEGEVVWQKAADHGHWLHGIKFHRLSSENSATIIKLINRMQLKPAAGAPDHWQSVPTDAAAEYAIATLRNLLKAKNSELFQHSIRTAVIAVTLGQALGLPPKKLVLLKQAALLHDIGRLEINRAIMEKREPLTPAEEQELQRHPIYGADLIKGIPILKPLAPIIRHHHERFDGQGYPDGLQGTSIPFLSRILAVANSVDIMFNPDFHQKEVHTPEQVIAAIRQEIGRKFDPTVARKCIELICAKKITKPLQTSS